MEGFWDAKHDQQTTRQLHILRCITLSNNYEQDTAQNNNRETRNNRKRPAHPAITVTKYNIPINSSGLALHTGPGSGITRNLGHSCTNIQAELSPPLAKASGPLPHSNPSFPVLLFATLYLTPFSPVHIYSSPINRVTHLTYFNIWRGGPPGRQINRPTWKVPGSQVAQSAPPTNDLSKYSYNTQHRIISLLYLWLQKNANLTSIQSTDLEHKNGSYNSFTLITTKWCIVILWRRISKRFHLLTRL